MIVNKRNGDSLAAEFSKILNKSLKKKASQESAGALLVEENSAEDKFADKNFLMDGAESSASDAEVLSNSLDDSVNMLAEGGYEEVVGGLVDLNEEMEGETAKEAQAKSIMIGLGKIASSLQSKGEKYAADMVVAAAHEINEDLMKEAAKTQFVKDELMKIASDLNKEGDAFSRDMVLATIKSL
jgi:phytoene dehydrogenase-like protein